MIVNGYKLDEEQESIVKYNNNLIVVAGAGSGKTLTIIGKIKYLINNNIKPYEILCISFTNASTNSLKEKIKDELNIDMNVYTFHKLGLEILKNNNKDYKIASVDTLDNIIDEFLYVDVLNNKEFIKYINNYFNSNNYYKLLESKDIIVFKNLLKTFIYFMKCNGLNIYSFKTLLFRAKLNIFHYKKDKIFLIIVLNIYLKYNKYLEDNNEIDFDDMIIKSINEVKNTNFKYKYIIVDEFQDTSYIRFKLIQEIIKYTNSKIMVVGDDYQSIYRFTGCDINIFLNFKKYIKNSKLLKITNTYRNSQELIDVASKFIMKNKSQIRKKLKSNKHISNPIEIIYYDNIEYTINELVKKLDKKILILGRNNMDLKLNINSNKDISYMTIHKSKGLEFDNVIIVNLTNRLLGFPSKIKEERILKYITKKEKYKYAEERRLFYVALTRTKNKVYLLVPKKNESEFVSEIKKYIR